MAFLRLQKEEAAELKYGVRQPHSKAYILTYCPILPLKSWFGNARMPLNNSNTDCQWLDRHTLLIQLQRRGQWLRDRQTQEIFTEEVNFDWKWLFRIYWTLALNWHWVQDIQNITAVLVQARVCRGQVMNGVLGPSHSGLCTHTGVISPVLECTVRIIRLILSNWQNPFIGSMTLEVRVILWERAKWKPLQLPLPWMSKVVAVAVLEVI